jgi:SAM-dependent methyltransferase
MYRNDWHVEHHDKTSYSADKILSIIFQIAPARSVLDVGCGHGDWLRAAQVLGSRDVTGCDGPWTDQDRLLIPRENFRCVDMRQALQLDRTFDLVICLEMAEHVEEEYAETLVNSLTAHGDMVFFGAAIPYQGGYRHVNEQWPSWWNALFARQGFLQFDPVRRVIWDDPLVHFWYKQNPLLYIRATRQDLIARARELEADGALPLDIVHPEKYLWSASYRSISFKPLLRALPGAVLRKTRSLLGQP